MYIKNLKLKNFRNYKEINIEFKENINLIYGNNGEGKTNILEAIYIASYGHSNKPTKDNEIINFDEKESHIKMDFLKNGIENTVEIHIKRDKKKGIAINGIKVKKISDIIGKVNLIFFSPEDLKIIKEGPQKRRDFLDKSLCEIDSVYLYNLVRYNKLLEKRNIILRDISQKINVRENKNFLYAIDENFIKCGEIIIKKRKAYIESIKENINYIYKYITDNKNEIETVYEKNVDEENFEKNLLKNQEKDIKNTTTSVGPHRDDIAFLLNGKDLRKYGSQGQTKIASFACKLSQIQNVRKISGEKPILLLDDVFSEIDEEKQEKLSNIIKDIQTIITATGIEKNIFKNIKVDQVYKIEKGQVINKVLWLNILLENLKGLKAGA